MADLYLPEPVGLQWRWLDDPSPRKLLRIGRRGTKSRFGLLAACHGHGPGWEEGTPLHRGILQGGDVVWLAQTYTNLTTVLWREEIEPRFGSVDGVRLRDGRDVCIEGGGSLLLRSAEPDAIRSVRGVGSRLAGVIVDEAAWLALRSALQDVILPALLDNGGWLIVMSTTNVGPDGDQDETGRPTVPSYFNQLAASIDRRERPGWAHFIGTAYDNPTLDPVAIDELVAEYPPGSIALRQEVYAELLDPGLGLVLPGLSVARHIVPAFSPPAHWPRFAGFDWGYHHPWSMSYGCADEDGSVYGIETIGGRLQLAEEIDATVRAAGVDPTQSIIHSGPDIWQSRQPGAKGGFRGPTIAEELIRLGWNMLPADNARVLGLDNLRRYTHVPPDKPAALPRFRWMDTPGNRLTLAQSAAMTVDPKRPEDALKVDADGSGRGGDDHYDSWRYMLMSRPITAKPIAPSEREGVSLGYDYDKHEPRRRVDAEQEIERMIQGPRGNTGSRYGIPRR